MATPLLIRVEEAAEMLGIGRSKLYEMVASGELPSVRIGRSRRIPVTAVHEWIADHVESRQSLAA